MANKHIWQLTAIDNVAEKIFLDHLETELATKGTVQEKLTFLEDEREAIRIEATELKAAKKEKRDVRPEFIRPIV